MGKGFFVHKMGRNNFYESVYEVIQLIPEGRVSSYGSIAKFLGTGFSARMVGWALRREHEALPAHRVVNSVGFLTGKSSFQSPTWMEEQLKKEGVTVINDKVINFERFFWDPTIELRG